jgi:hypothetical protein
LIKSAGIDLNLSGWQQLYMSAIHGARGRSLEIDAFAVVSAPVARTLELVFALFPVGSTAQVGAASKDGKNTFRIPNHPDAVGLLESGIDAEPEVGRIADHENGLRLEKGPGEKEPEKHQEIDAENAYDGTNNQFPPEFYYLAGRSTLFPCCLLAFR